MGLGGSDSDSAVASCWVRNLVSSPSHTRDFGLIGKLAPMPGNVALWERDIRPPLAWLVPSVLYQEKISTLAPLTDGPDRDGRETFELKQQLGELYVPLSLSQVLHEPVHLEALLGLLRSRLPVWNRWIQRRSVRTSDHYSWSWLGRSTGWPERRAAPGRSRRSGNNCGKDRARRTPNRPQSGWEYWMLRLRHSASRSPARALRFERSLLGKEPIEDQRMRRLSADGQRL